MKSDGSETLVNYRREGNYIVVDKVSRQWTLRSGSIVSCVFNMKLTGKSAVRASFGEAAMTVDFEREANFGETVAMKGRGRPNPLVAGLLVSVAIGALGYAGYVSYVKQTP